MKRRTITKKTEKIENGIECPICINECKREEIFKCFSCNQEYCIECSKTYLLGSTQDPHCLHCRSVIPYDIFVEKFDMKWRLGDYKKQKEKILWDKEQSLLPATVGMLERKKEVVKIQKKKNELYAKIAELDAEIYAIEGEVRSKKVVKYTWTQTCPTKDCKGFLNGKYECSICDKKYCKDCMEELKEKEHECNEELKETMKLIRKESKPCPKCGEFISKISGCDQMFCTSCGTAFSWNTGNIEKGVIHNPHAHQFFQNNQEAYQQYRHTLDAGRGGVAGAGECRPLIPQIFDLSKIPGYIKPPPRYNYGYGYGWNGSQGSTTLKQEKENEKSVFIRLPEYHRYIAEYNQYARTRIERQINEEDENMDLRERYLENELTEKSFKSTLHMREKKRLYRKRVHEIIISTVMIMGGLLWSAMDCKTEDELKRIQKMFLELRDSTNEMLKKLALEHKYTTSVEISIDMRIPSY